MEFIISTISLLLLVILVFAFVQVIMNTTKVVTKIFILYNIYAMASYIITMIVTFANIYRVEGLLDDNVPVYKVRDFLYFSIITWTTTGYGDIKPSPDSRIFAAAEALIGYMTMGLFLAIAFYIISSRGKYRNIRRDDRKPSRISSEDAEGKDGKAL